MNLKEVTLGVICVYVCFLITYIFHNNTHNIFNCEYYELLDWWCCSILHVITDLVFFILLFIGIVKLRYSKI